MLTFFKKKKHTNYLIIVSSDGLFLRGVPEKSQCSSYTA